MLLDALGTAATAEGAGAADDGGPANPAGWLSVVAVGSSSTAAMRARAAVTSEHTPETCRWPSCPLDSVKDTSPSNCPALRPGVIRTRTAVVALGDTRIFALRVRSAASNVASSGHPVAAS